MAANPTIAEAQKVSLAAIGRSMSTIIANLRPKEARPEMERRNRSLSFLSYRKGTISDENKYGYTALSSHDPDAKVAAPQAQKDASTLTQNQVDAMLLGFGSQSVSVAGLDPRSESKSSPAQTVRFIPSVYGGLLSQAAKDLSILHALLTFLLKEHSDLGWIWGRRHLQLWNYFMILNDIVRTLTKERDVDCTLPDTAVTRHFVRLLDGGMAVKRFVDFIALLQSHTDNVFKQNASLTKEVLDLLVKSMSEEFGKNVELLQTLFLWLGTSQPEDSLEVGEIRKPLEL
ncbi:MAG: hypothetical protein Q9227_008752 [Pyrenula ochraceoflavens]